jgi:hypothetical protein
MSTKEPGIHDADGWITFWTSLHRSDLFWGEFNSLALKRLEGDALAEGVGSDILTVDDDGQPSRSRSSTWSNSSQEAESFTLCRYAAQETPLRQLFRLNLRANDEAKRVQPRA